MRLSSLLLSTAVLALSSCRDLPTIASNECGNGVVDRGEDCDTFGVGSSRCRAMGEAMACHLDCSPAGDGAATACPAGFGCGRDFVCRSPSGAYEGAALGIVSEAERLEVADFDGDGNLDVAAFGPQSGLGESSVRLHYFGEGGGLELTSPVRARMAGPAILDVDGDKLADFAFASIVLGALGGGGVSVLRGQGDRSLTPNAYSTFTLPPGSQARLVRVRGVNQPNELSSLLGEDAIVFARYAAPQGNLDAIVPRGVASLDSVLGILPRPPEELVGEPIAANTNTKDSPCEELYFAYQGEQRVLSFDICDREGKLDNSLAQPTVAVELPAGRTVTEGVRAHDIDGDGHIDLLIGVGKRTLVAFGHGDGTFGSTPPSMGPANKQAAIAVADSDENVEIEGFPLAIGNVAAPGGTITAVVLSDSLEIVTSVIPTGKKVRLASSNVVFRVGSPPWTTAAIADINGDRLADVVAGSQTNLDLDVLLGTGTGLFNSSTLATEGEIERLAIGDFDGDLINDIALVMAQGDEATTSNQLAFAFGRALSTPEAPARNGRLPDVKQVISSMVTGVDTAAELGVVSANAMADGDFIAVLNGSGDRQPLASFGLNSTDPDGGMAPLVGVPVAVAHGAFLGADRRSLAMLALTQRFGGNNDSTELRLWHAPLDAQGNLAVADPSPALPLALLPFSSNLEASQGGLSAILRAADLDGDGRDELVYLTTELSFGADTVTEVGARLLIGRATDRAFTIDAPIAIAAVPYRFAGASGVSMVDIDGDGAVDMVGYFEGRRGKSTLLVAFNDGGKLAVDSAVVITAARADGTELSATSFAVADIDRTGHKSVLFATEQGVHVARRRASSPRAFDVSKLFDAKGITTIGAGDLTGDGLVDVVAVEADGLQLFKARSKQPN